MYDKLYKLNESSKILGYTYCPLDRKRSFRELSLLQFTFHLLETVFISGPPCSFVLILPFASQFFNFHYSHQKKIEFELDSPCFLDFDFFILSGKKIKTKLQSGGWPAVLALLPFSGNSGSECQQAGQYHLIGLVSPLSAFNKILKHCQRQKY